VASHAKVPVLVVPHDAPVPGDDDAERS
jgi:hypothetical protein